VTLNRRKCRCRMPETEIVVTSPSQKPPPPPRKGCRYYVRRWVMRRPFFHRARSLFFTILLVLLCGIIWRMIDGWGSFSFVMDERQCRSGTAARGRGSVFDPSNASIESFLEHGGAEQKLAELRQRGVDRAPMALPLELEAVPAVELGSNTRTDTERLPGDMEAVDACRGNASPQCGCGGSGSCYDGLPSKPWWSEEIQPFASAIQTLRANMPAIRHELLSNHVRSFRRQGLAEREGKRGWMTSLVWSAVDGWREDACAQLPTLCRIMTQHLPTVAVPLHSPCQEELEVFGMEPGGHILPHSDGCGGRIGMLTCVAGCTGHAWHRVWDSRGEPTTRYLVLVNPNRTVTHC